MLHFLVYLKSRITFAEMPSVQAFWRYRIQVPIAVSWIFLIFDLGGAENPKNDSIIEIKAKLVLPFVGLSSMEIFLKVLPSAGFNNISEF